MEMEATGPATTGVLVCQAIGISTHSSPEIAELSTKTMVTPGCLQGSAVTPRSASPEATNTSSTNLLLKRAKNSRSDLLSPDVLDGIPGSHVSSMEHEMDALTIDNQQWSAAVPTELA